MKILKIKITLMIITAVAMFIILIIKTMAYFDNDTRNNEFYTLLNEPTFVGEVVDKRFVWRVDPLMFTRRPERRLHIVGEYIYDNRTIQVDRVFIVSWYLYNRFDIGDSIGRGLRE